MTAEFPIPDGLAALEARVRQDYAWLDLPAKPWVPETSIDGQAVLDAAIVGGGMAGLALANAMKNLGLRVQVYDQAPAGFEGPWATTARMETLRSPKQLTGPALGFPALTFRAWFESQFGAQAWEELDKIPRLQWMDYLRWYRQVNGIAIANEHEVLDIVPSADHVRLRIRGAQGEFDVLARHVVLATGRAGLGGPSLPDWAQAIASGARAHSSDVMDYAELRGKRVAVIGAGASAMDSAATALENGALGVDLLIRRADIPRVNKGKGLGSPGAVHGTLGLPDEWKWKIRHYIGEPQVPPPRGSVLRVSRHANARFYLDAGVQGAAMDGEQVVLQTKRGERRYDFVIFATGFKVDWRSRPEYRTIAPAIRVWGDRFAEPAGQESQELRESPDLGDLFEFQPREPGQMPGLERVHCFCYPATLTHGQVSGDIPAISDGALRLSQGLCRQLFVEDAPIHFERLQAYDEPEVHGDEWAPAQD